MVVFETVEWLVGVVNPTVKDFTTEAEEEIDDGIIALANELNASETFFDRTLEFLGKCLLHFAFVRLIFKYLGMYKDSIIDFYNYTGNTISQIFTQARKCDNLYGTKLSDYNEKISNSALLLNNLSELFDISNDEYFGDNVLERMEMFHSHKESLLAMNEIRGLEDIDIESYIINTSAKEDFDGYSDDIYKELGIDNTKIINSEDDNEEFWLNIWL